MYAYMPAQRRRRVGRTHVTALGLTAHAQNGSFKTNAAICCVFKVLYLHFVKPSYFDDIL